MKIRFTPLLLGLLIVKGLPLASAAELGEPLEREQLIAAVLAGNASIDALEAAEQAAVLRIEPAGALDDPMLSTSIAPRQFDGGGEMDRSFSLELSQNLPWPGKRTDREAVARAESRVAGAQIESRKLRLRELAASAWAEWAFVEQALAINAEHQQLLEELRSTAESQYAAGHGGQQDVLQAEMERRVLQKQAIELERQRAELRARINSLLNRSPDAPLPTPAALPRPHSPQPYERLATLARRGHPELKRIEHRIGGRKSRVDLAEKAFYPDFRVSAGYNSMWNDPRHRPMIGLSINLPLDQSKRRAELNAARAEARESEWQLIDQRSRLLAELEGARAATSESLQSYALYRDDLLPLARDSLDAAIADYTAGRSDFINIISAERQQLATALGLVRALADYHRRMAALERTVGQPLLQENRSAEPLDLDELTMLPGGSDS